MTDAKFTRAISNALNAIGINVNSSIIDTIANSIVAEIGNPRFFALPDVLYAEVDTGVVEKSIVTIYEGIMNKILYPADPVRLFLSSLAVIIAHQNAVVNHTNKMNLLRYAMGAFLDHLGVFLNVYRHDEFPAKTRLKFSLQTKRNVSTVIPQGTRATADSRIFFATDLVLLIPAEELSAEIEATCLTYGVEGNGLIPGQINKIVDLIPGVTKVENVEPTTGGSDVEDDDSLQKRIRLAPAAFSTAGGELSYIYWSLSAHGNISDVSVFSPLPGIVNVFVMLKGGVIPDANSAEIEAVVETLNEKQHRPLTDFVAVYPINYEPIDYSVTWYITSGQAILFNEINERIQNAIRAYESWQVERVGRDIVPDRLIRLCLEAGAKRVVLDGLYFTKIDNSSIVKFVENPERIIFGGVENE
jgi:phage-related baseplate assembly protein